MFPFDLIYLLLSLAFLATAHRRPYTGSFLLKSAPIFLLAWVVFGRISPIQPWLLLALIFSAGGDIILDFDNFVGGLVSFLIAHICYVIAFALNMQFTFLALLPIVIFLLTVIILIHQLLPTLGKLRFPVLLYITAILGMGITASLHTPLSWSLIIGAFIFILSDATIAINKFLRPVPYRDWIVMITYYLAQFLIIRSFLF